MLDFLPDVYRSFCFSHLSKWGLHFFSCSGPKPQSSLILSLSHTLHVIHQQILLTLFFAKYPESTPHICYDILVHTAINCSGLLMACLPLCFSPCGLLFILTHAGGVSLLICKFKHVTSQYKAALWLSTRLGIRFKVSIIVCRAL